MSVFIAVPTSCPILAKWTNRRTTHVEQQKGEGGEEGGEEGAEDVG